MHQKNTEQHASMIPVTVGVLDEMHGSENYDIRLGCQNIWECWFVPSLPETHRKTWLGKVEPVSGFTDADTAEEGVIFLLQRQFVSHTSEDLSSLPRWGVQQ